jgi:hypothetical protein
MCNPENSKKEVHTFYLPIPPADMEIPELGLYSRV